MSTERLAQLRAMIAARTDSDGKAKLGYGANVSAVRREIARLEAAQKIEELLDSPPAEAP
jgi:hypothetical protein